MGMEARRASSGLEGQSHLDQMARTEMVGILKALEGPNVTSGILRQVANQLNELASRTDEYFDRGQSEG